MRLSVEAARDALLRRSRLADTEALEATTERFLQAVFAAQAEAFGTGPVASVQAADRRMDRAIAATADTFETGMRALLRASMRVGALRAGRAMGGVFVAEAVLAAPPVTAPPMPRLMDPDGPFALDHPRATAWLNEHAAAMVRGVDAHTREVIAGTVTRGVDFGRSSEKIGKRIAARFEEMRVGKPQQHIASRAHGIAVTEMAFGYEQGKKQLVAQLTDLGLEVVKAWLTTGDSRVDDVCSGNAGAGEVDVDERFPSGHEEPPGHPYCRCTALYRTLTSTQRADRTINRLGAPLPPPAPKSDPLALLARQKVQPTHRGVAEFTPGRVERMVEDGRTTYSRGDTYHAAINKVQGYDGPATKVTRQEFDDLLAEGKVREAFRGVPDTGQMRSFRDGDFYPGNGIYGNGTYAAGWSTNFEGSLTHRRGMLFPGDDLPAGTVDAVRVNARFRAAETARAYGNGRDDVMRIGIPDSARVMDFQRERNRYQTFRSDLYARKTTARAVWAEAEDTLQGWARYHDINHPRDLPVSLRDDVRRAKEAYEELERVDLLTDDIGRWATMEGYDAIHETGNDYWVILNRTAVVVQDTEADVSDLEALAIAARGALN